MISRQHEHGVAIVLAMGVVALAALTATAIVVSQSTWSTHIGLSTDYVQAQHLNQAGLDWTRSILSDDRRASSVDHPGEPWAMQLPPIPVENGSLAGHIEDLQGKFNLNNLLKGGRIDVAQLERFRRLLSILDLPPALASALADWIDADSEPQPYGGAEDAYYLSQQPPYLAANQPLTDIAELALVRGFSADVRERLRPFVAALPGITALNVNTASPEVIAAVIVGLHLDAARALAAQRERIYFRNYSDFFGQLPPGLVVPNEHISVSSDYFLVTMSVSMGGAQARGSALLKREGAGWPMVVWRKFP